MTENALSSVAQQPILAPRLFSRSFSLSLLIAVIGLLVTLLIFYLAKREVDALLARQLGQPVVEAVSHLQQRVDDDEHLIGSLAGLLALNPDLTKDDLHQFIKVTELDRNTFEHMYLVLAANHEFHIHDEVINRSFPNTPSFSPENLSGIDSIIQYASDTSHAASAILYDRHNPANKWFVIAQPLRGKAGRPNVVVGFSRLDSLFDEFRMLQAEGVMTSFVVREDTDPALTTPFLNLRSPVPLIDLLLFLPATDLRITLDSGRVWHIAFVSSLRGTIPLIATLPYIQMLIGFLLTWALIMYLRATRARSAEIANLALSLRRVNGQLNHKVAYEERMARALRDSEQRFRAIFENAGIGICQISPVGEWLNANRTMAHILSYDNPQELLAAQPDFHGQLFVDSRQRQEWFAKLQDGNQREYEVELYTRDRRAIWVNMSGHAVHDEGSGKTYFECTMYDVTERRQGEFALIQAKEQADFANRSKSEFLANMSHELRTPLNAIIGFAEIIKEQMFGPAGQPQYVEYARDIYDSGDLLLSLINDILDMSKIEAAKRALVEATLDVERVVQSVVRLVASRAKLGKLHLNVRVPKDLPALRGEEKALKQILTNLLTNAIKFTPEGGDVTLLAKMDKFGRMCIQIEDTGIGIAPEDIPVALAPFGQIESALSRKNQGTGLGLPLTKALVELHGGVLDLQSKIGVGTIVTAVFPAERVVAKPV